MSHMDSQLVEKIVTEVKSQGAFDEFRKDSMSDVDTKPAYQNLRQRVENAVKKFLSEQRWTPETNKNQLRERLRRHISESGFLDVGVERIVDQVVNPKVGSVFQPRIEDIAYKYLGVPQPPSYIKCEPLIHALPPLPPLPSSNGNALRVETTTSLLPTDLEQVSPDSDKATVKSECKEELEEDMDLDDKPEDDDESPPFEPLVKETRFVKTDLTDSDMDTSDSPEPPPIMPPGEEDSTSNGGRHRAAVDTETQDTSVSVNTGELDSEKETSRSLDAVASQESQLSQVSSDSRISTASNDFNENAAETNSQSKLENVAVNISEEAQMPKFNENSSSETNGAQNVSQLHFDIKKDEIKFEGTERKTNLMPEENKDNSASDHTADCTLNNELGNEPKKNTNAANNTFQFASLVVEEDRTPAAQDSSFGSSLLDDTSTSAQLCIVEKSQKSEASIAVAEQKSLSDTAIVTHNTNTENANDVNNGTLTTTAPPTPSPSQQRAKDESERQSSSSSSRHKKHSKDKRSSYDSKDNSSSNNKHSKSSHDKDYKSRDRHSHSKHSSSSSSKHSSSTHKKTESAHRNNINNDKNATTANKHLTSSSSCSSSRSEPNDTKRDSHRDSEKKLSNNKDAGTKKSHRKTGNDDHTESKNKLHWRKSTDSNDDDKSPNGAANNSGQQQTKSTSTTNVSSSSSNTKTKSKGSNEVNSKTTQKDSMEQNNNESTWQHTQIQQNRNNVVILNDILQNPSTDFIELETTLNANHVQVVRCTPTLTTAALIGLTTAVANKEEDVLFFEEMSDQFATRLKILDNVMNSCRHAVNSLRFDYPADETESLDRVYEKNTESNDKRNCFSSAIVDSSAQEIPLLIDCVSYKNQKTKVLADPVVFETDIDKTPRKRFKHNGDNESSAANKPSPTPSDTSVNSKENEVFDKNFSDNRRRNLAVSKLSQQRYASEDLYKPRPILSQRSRRRVLD